MSGEKKSPKSIEENDVLPHFLRKKQQLQAIVIHLSWAGNGKHNCRVKKRKKNCFLHQIVLWYNCNKHLESLLRQTTSAVNTVSRV